MILDKDAPTDEDANSELNTTIIRTGEKKADVDQSAISLTDVAVDISQSDILPQTDADEKKEAQESGQ